MEKHSKCIVIPYTAYWKDIGSYNSLFEHFKQLTPTISKKNVTFGKNIFPLDCEDCVIHNDHDNDDDTKIMCTLGLDNIVVVNTQDVLLVSHKNRSQDVKKLTELLKGDESKCHYTIQHVVCHRPWGYYETIKGTDFTGYKVKRITVYPGKRLSLQSHERRAEHWVISVKMTLFVMKMILEENKLYYGPR